MYCFFIFPQGKQAALLNYPRDPDQPWSMQVTLLTPEFHLLPARGDVHQSIDASLQHPPITQTWPVPTPSADLPPVRNLITNEAGNLSLITVPFFFKSRLRQPLIHSLEHGPLLLQVPLAAATDTLPRARSSSPTWQTARWRPNRRSSSCSLGAARNRPCAATASSVPSPGH
jgi:hypothetical protein